MTAWNEGREDRGPTTTPLPSRGRRLMWMLGLMAFAWGGIAAVYATSNSPKLGLDLAGGTSVILAAPEGTSGEQLDQAVNVMRKRIEALGSVQEPVRRGPRR